ncbi:hypothetical protein JTE90_029394 [Oedothorax gibbosus]|uniref:Uncharacterized protein n=1 Tax=Oedothorax gibbosus TaxID=931172 RepID=A0AAV6VMR9_9ARAC|nr:hypothetical protein JTE90_029394 [Oedothorax gibbosus]
MPNVHDIADKRTTEQLLSRERTKNKKGTTAWRRSTPRRIRRETPRMVQEINRTIPQMPNVHDIADKRTTEQLLSRERTKNKKGTTGIIIQRSGG